MDKKQFDKQKKDILSKEDFSKKGSVDEKVKGIISYINTLENYYTTSSCSGRIMILTRPKSLKKNETEWLLSSHDEIKFSDVLSALKEVPQDDIFFRQECMILHVACFTFEDAVKLMNLVRECGFRRAGIISAERYVVEIISSEQLNVPLASDGKLIVDEKYLRILTDIANDKMQTTFDRINKLEEKLRSDLKD